MVFEDVHKALERVKVLFVFRQQSAWVAPRLVQVWHASPLLPVQVEALAVGDHHLVLVATSDGVDVSIAKGVVRRKTSPPNENFRLF